MQPVARFETLTRLGFAARGLTYILIGWLAIEAGRAADPSEALATLAEGPGRLLLGLIAVGLFAYGAWKLMEAVFDLEGHGGDAKGTATRVGHGMSGAAHIFLALTALELATGSPAAANGGSGQTAREATSWLLTLPAGGLLVRLIAATLFAVAVYQIVQAIRLQFLRQLAPEATSKAWVKWVGRLGYLARGVVFGLVAVMLWRAGEAASPAAAGGTGEALASLSGTTQAVVAAGLAMFGIFSLVQAVYRRITNPQVVERLRARFA